MAVVTPLLAVEDATDAAALEVVEDATESAEYGDGDDRGD